MGEKETGAVRHYLTTIGPVADPGLLDLEIVAGDPGKTPGPVDELAHVVQRYPLRHVGLIQKPDLVAGDPPLLRRQVQEQRGGPVCPEFQQLPIAALGLGWAQQLESRCHGRV